MYVVSFTRKYNLNKILNKPLSYVSRISNVVPIIQETEQI